MSFMEGKWWRLAVNKTKENWPPLKLLPNERDKVKAQQSLARALAKSECAKARAGLRARLTI